MKRVLIVMVLCLCVAGTSAQKTSAKKPTKASRHNITHDIPNFRGFDAIRAEGIVDVEYRQSTAGTTNVTVYGSDNVLRHHLEIVNEGGTLVARIRKNVRIINDSKIKVIASSPTLKKVSASGNSDVTLVGNIRAADLVLVATGSADIQFDAIRCDNLKIQCTGSSDVEGRQIECRALDMAMSGTGDASIRQIEAASVKITSSGTSDVEIAGRTNYVMINISGTSEVDAFGLRAERVNARASGVSKVSCYAERILDAHASGRSSIIYGGNPVSVNITGNQNLVRPYQSYRSPRRR